MKREDQELEPLLGALRRVRRRLRWQAALDGAARGCVLAGVVGVPAVALVRLGILRGRVAAVATAAVLVLAVLEAVLRSLPLRGVAERVDRTHVLTDRLRSALELSTLEPRTAFVQAAIDDGVRVARMVLVGRAAPLTRPRHLGTAVVLGLSALLVARFPSRAVGETGAGIGNRLALPPASLAVEEPRLRVAPERFEPEREAARELLHEAVGDGHAEAAGLARGLLAVHAELARGGLSRREVLERLGRLEREATGSEGAVEAAGALRQAAEKLARVPAAEGLATSLARGDVKQARRELESLAERLSRPEEERERRRMGAALEERPTHADKKRGGGEGGAKAALAALSEKVRRMEQVQRGQELVSETREVIRRGRQDEKQVERAAGAKNGTGAQAAAAADSMTGRADSMTGAQGATAGHASRETQGRATGSEGAGATKSDAGNKPVTNEAARAGGGGRAGDEGSSSRGPAGAGAARSGDAAGAATGGSGDAAGAAIGGSGDAAGAATGGSGDAAGSLRDYLSRARGATKEEGDRSAPKEHGAAGPLVGENGGAPSPVEEHRAAGPPVGEHGGAPSPVAERGEAGSAVAELSGEPGTFEARPRGWGDTHDPNLFGPDSGRAAAGAGRRAIGKMHALQLDGASGAKGPGSSRAETILRSSERGFASEHYRRVFRDYTAVTEEVLDKEQVPPGYRYYVKRYFQLIRPRD